MAAQVPQARVVLGEWSDGALKICRQNVRRNSLTARVVPMQADAREKAGEIPGRVPVHRVQSPYIPGRTSRRWTPPSRTMNPIWPWTAARDGLDFYRSISEKWKEALAPGGRLYFEVGIGQADNVLRIMRTQGFGDIQVVKDHHDIPGWYSERCVQSSDV